VMALTDGSTTRTLVMTSTEVVETSVNVTTNSPPQDHTHPDNHNLPTSVMTPGFKPFTDSCSEIQMTGMDKNLIFNFLSFK